jgi:hypothetical protein
VRGLGVCFCRKLRLLLGSDCKILIDFVWCDTILKPSIPNASLAKVLVTAPRNYFANPVPKGNANDKNQNPWPHVRENTPWLGFPFKSCEITLIRRIKFPLRQNGCTDIVQWPARLGKTPDRILTKLLS